jgi:hypothetical protein
VGVEADGAVARSGRQREEERRRNARKRVVRARTENVRHTISKVRLRLLVEENKQDEHLLNGKPHTRGECASVPRPCPYVSCAMHLYLDTTPAGNVRVNFPDLEPDEMDPDGSCALDVADKGESVLERVGELLNVTRERVRQIEARALSRLRRAHTKLLQEIFGT